MADYPREVWKNNFSKAQQAVLVASSGKLSNLDLQSPSLPSPPAMLSCTCGKKHPFTHHSAATITLHNYIVYVHTQVHSKDNDYWIVDK